MKSLASLLHETFRQWSTHRVPRMGAALSFYTIFSLAPLAILTLSLVSLAIDRSAARAEMIDMIRYQVGTEGADTVSMILAKTASASSGTSTWEAVIGFIVLLVGSSGVFGELQDSLNQIWDVTPQRHPVLLIIKERAISFVMVLVISFFMLISFLFSAAVAIAGSYLHGKFPSLDGIWELANSGVSLVVIALLFALIYRVIPDARVAWRDVWSGAAIAAVLFVLGKYVLGFYFGRSAIASSYGAAGSVIIVLVWVYYSAQIMFFGAEFTRVYAQRHGSQRPLQGKEIPQLAKPQGLQ
jgi:membrane protein